MPTSYDFDYFVIGAGSGGVRSARIAAGHGAKVGIAEGRFFGGTCVNIGCVPKKIFAYAADMHPEFEDAAGYGWDINGKPKFDWSTLIANKDKEINRLNGIYETMLQNAGVTIHNGNAEFVDAHTLKIGGQTVTAKHILIATGGKPFKTSIKGNEHIIVSDDAFYLKKLPKSVIISGGGYIAVEFAHIFNGLGVDTTLVHRGDLFMRGFDMHMREALRDHMSTKGIKLLFNTEITSVTKLNGQNHDFNVGLQDGSTAQTDLVMAAIGRTPLTDNMNLSNAGVKLDAKGAVMVDDKYATNIPHIYAVGDVTNRVQLTPVALAEGHWLADTLFGNISRPVPSYENIATAVFSDPNISTIGLSEEDALKKGHKIKVFLSNFRPMKYILPQRDEKTTMKLIVDQDTDKILGLHIIGLDAAEMLQGFAVAIIAGATKADFDNTIGIHPTSSEELVTMRKPSYLKP